MNHFTGRIITGISSVYSINIFSCLLHQFIIIIRNSLQRLGIELLVWFGWKEENRRYLWYI